MGIGLGVQLQEIVLQHVPAAIIDRRRAFV